MTIYEDARYQIQWHMDNGRLVGATDLILAAVAAGEAAEAKLAEIERERKHALAMNAGHANASLKWMEECKASESREKALREALEQIRDEIASPGHGSAHRIGAIARAALAAGKEGM